MLLRSLFIVFGVIFANASVFALSFYWPAPAWAFPSATALGLVAGLLGMIFPKFGLETFATAYVVPLYTFGILSVIHLIVGPAHWSYSAILIICMALPVARTARLLFRVVSIASRAAERGRFHDLRRFLREPKLYVFSARHPWIVIPILIALFMISKLFGNAFVLLLFFFSLFALLTDMLLTTLSVDRIPPLVFTRTRRSSNQGGHVA